MRLNDEVCRIYIDAKQKWDAHFNGSGGLIKALNKRTFIIRRVSDQLPRNKIINLVHSIWMSKLRYGLQLCNKVRTKNEDPENGNMTSTQICQNKMLRMLDRVSLKEHIPSTVLREKYGLPSVNQLAAEIKILEAWKSINVDNYPFQMELANPGRNTQGRSIRETTEKKVGRLDPLQSK